jgi:hypothetical protein
MHFSVTRDPTQTRRSAPHQCIRSTNQISRSRHAQWFRYLRRRRLASNRLGVLSMIRASVRAGCATPGLSAAACRVRSSASTVDSEGPGPHDSGADGVTTGGPPGGSPLALLAAPRDWRQQTVRPRWSHPRASRPGFRAGPNESSQRLAKLQDRIGVRQHVAHVVPRR